MSESDKNRRSSHFLASEIEEFLVDRQARNFTPHTLAYKTPGFYVTLL
jgi:hypothetical protein